MQRIIAEPHNALYYVRQFGSGMVLTRPQVTRPRPGPPRPGPRPYLCKAKPTCTKAVKHLIHITTNVFFTLLHTLQYKSYM